jgi:ATP-dependent Lon protease
MEIQNCDDMRDNRAIEAGASGYLKLLFPDLELTEEDFYKYCVNPAIELRQRVHDELCKMDREYRPVSMRSKTPDTFQLTHRPPEFVDHSEIELAPLKQSSQPIEDALTNTEEPDNIYLPTTEPELPEKTIHIQEGEMGHSYKSLFGDYLKGASFIHLIDPYVRMEFQVRNLLAFMGIIDTVDGSKELLLTTSSDDEYQQKTNSQKFDEIANSLADHGINFKYEFSSTTHRRGIELDNGWRIIIDRGLDI